MRSMRLMTGKGKRKGKISVGRYSCKRQFARRGRFRIRKAKTGQTQERAKDSEAARKRKSTQRELGGECDQPGRLYNAQFDKGKRVEELGQHVQLMR